MERLLRSADFQRVLSAPARSRSAHFALHHLPQPPLPGPKPAGQASVPSLTTDLSTGQAGSLPQPVDDLPSWAGTGLWWGCVVPKRHARRAVTRNLLKRQIRSLMGLHAAALPPGQWLVRLRSPFALAQFPSARSDALASAARAEIDKLLAHATRPAQPRGPSSPRSETFNPLP